MSGTCRTVANHLRVYSQTIQALYISIPTFPKFPMQAQVPENPESSGHGRSMSGARSIMPYNPLSISHIPLVTSAPYIQNHTLSFDFTTIPWVLGLCLKTQNLGISECSLMDLLPKNSETQTLALQPWDLRISLSSASGMVRHHLQSEFPSSRSIKWAPQLLHKSKL